MTLFSVLANLKQIDGAQRQLYSYKVRKDIAYSYVSYYYFLFHFRVN